MSGHSKWKTIKRQKGKSDIKKGQVFTKISNAITLAVKLGGGVGDPEQNFRLRLAMDKAKEENMPKENIERAIEKGQGKGGKGEEFWETVYEGFTPGGIAVIVEAATNNKQRTSSEVKNVFDKNGGAMGTVGSVSYMFASKGQITVKRDSKTFDEIFEIAVEAGAQDVEDAGEDILIYTNANELAKVRDEISVRGVAIATFELMRKPSVATYIEDAEVAEKIFSFIEKMENLDDVQKVYANFDLSDEIVNSL